MSQELPGAGSVAVELAYTGVGCMFAVVGAVAAQLTEDAGAARGFGLGALGVAFVLRLVGDVSGDRLSWLSWLSRSGGASRSAPRRRALVSSGARRRLRGPGQRRGRCGVRTARRRRRAGAPTTPAPRLPRRGCAARSRWPRACTGARWSAGRSGSPRSASSSAPPPTASERSRQPRAPGDQEIFIRVGGQAALTDAYLAALMVFLAFIASAQAIQATLRMRTEEAGQRAEPVLSASVRRLRWAVSHLVFAAAGPVVVLVAGGVATGLSYELTAGDVAGQLAAPAGQRARAAPRRVGAGRACGSCLRPAPETRRRRELGSAGPVLPGRPVGPVLRLDQWAMNISPFTRVPRMPGSELTLAPLLWLAGIAVLLTAAGLAAFNQRDIPAV